MRKSRLSGVAVAAEELIGAVTDQAPLVVDDMISTGGTVEAAVQLLLRRGAAPEVTVVATHGVFVGPAAARLGPLPIRRPPVSDSLAPPDLDGLPAVSVVSVADLLADAIRRLHGGQQLDDLLVRS